MSGPIATEYAAHVAEPSSASTSPFTFAERLPPDPTATRATPAKEKTAAIQKRSGRCSTPLPRAKSAAVEKTMIGRSWRAMLNEPSQTRVMAAKIRPAHAYLVDEYASGWKPW